MADLTTGLNTLVDLDASPPNVRVQWLAWDSPFRGSGLRVGDRIVAVNGVPLACPRDQTERQRLTTSLPGQLSEHQAFESAGLKAGAPLALRVRRRARPEGWAELDISAPLAERSPSWRNADNRETLGPGGPVSMVNDNFYTGGWGGWYQETLVRQLGYLLDEDQHTGTFVSRYEYKSLRETHGDRVDFACKTYPGPWADALRQDVDAALALCAGQAVTLPPNALDFRRRGEELAAQVRAQSQAAWAQAKAMHVADTIPAFPAVHPVRGDVRPVTGKLVLLPPLRNRDWINESGRGWFAIEGDGWYFIDAEGEAAQAMLIAQRRYTRLVDPNVPAQWEFLARITGESRLLVVNEQARYGLVLEPVAALVGGAMFVDLGRRQGTQVAFTGEAGLMDDTPDVPPPDASPAEVLMALVGAVKMGDLALWRALHADWSIERRAGEPGQPERLAVHPYAPPPSDSMFELSRRSVMGRVLDARVAWVDDPRVLVDGRRFEGARAIDEVEVWLDHIGDFSAEGDGLRTFSDVTVRVRWRLQRVDGGPWRVAEAQPI